LLALVLLLGTSAGTGCGGDDAERRASIERLLATPSAADVARIRSLAHDPDRDVRALSLQALAQLPFADGGGLALELLADPDPYVRGAAIRLLGEHGVAEHAQPIVELLLYDPDGLVRLRAAEALGKIGGEPAAAGLIAALGDSTPSVRVACIAALDELQAVSALPEIARLLVEDESWEVRAQAASALGAIGGEAVTAVLETALADENEFVQAAASSALHQVP
jgi:HEAT repeat protein